MVFRFAPHGGGAVIVATEIANNLAKLDHKITVLTPDLDLKGRPYDVKIHKNVQKAGVRKN